MPRAGWVMEDGVYQVLAAFRDGGFHPPVAWDRAFIHFDRLRWLGYLREAGNGLYYASHDGLAALARQDRMRGSDDRIFGR